MYTFHVHNAEGGYGGRTVANSTIAYGARSGHDSQLLGRAAFQGFRAKVLEAESPKSFIRRGGRACMAAKY